MSVLPANRHDQWRSWNLDKVEAGNFEKDYNIVENPQIKKSKVKYTLSVILVFRNPLDKNEYLQESQQKYKNETKNVSENVLFVSQIS